MRRVSHILVLAAGSLVLAGCSGMDDRSRSIARCERTAAQGVENPQQAAQLAHWSAANLMAGANARSGRYWALLAARCLAEKSTAAD